mmetsp:Transcript_29476/g.91049  ORF Transcript_29476/g.91049 Transcript_29476/m.91049 type:complete len:235 (-) Transcript_29476:7-711(-)
MSLGRHVRQLSRDTRSLSTAVGKRATEKRAASQCRAAWHHQPRLADRLCPVAVDIPSVGACRYIRMARFPDRWFRQPPSTRYRRRAFRRLTAFPWPIAFPCAARCSPSRSRPRLVAVSRCGFRRCPVCLLPQPRTSRQAARLTTCHMRVDATHAGQLVLVLAHHHCNTLFSCTLLPLTTGHHSAFRSTFLKPWSIGSDELQTRHLVFTFARFCTALFLRTSRPPHTASRSHETV